MDNNEQPVVRLNRASDLGAPQQPTHWYLQRGYYGGASFWDDHVHRDCRVIASQPYDQNPFKEKAPMTTEEKKHPDIPLTAVESSQLEAIGYDSATKTLAIRFKGGGIYHYPNVEPDVHADFMKAESKGKFFGKHLKSRKDFVRTNPKKKAA